MEITAEFLKYHYVELKKSSEQIGTECGLSGRMIRYYLKHHGFEDEMRKRRQTAGTGKEPANKGKTQTDNPKLGRYYVTSKGRVIPRARLVMEQHLGRTLQQREIVHHKDENPLNDSIENLELLPNQRAHIQHHKPRRRKRSK